MSLLYLVSLTSTESEGQGSGWLNSVTNIIFNDLYKMRAFIKDHLENNKRIIYQTT